MGIDLLQAQPFEICSIRPPTENSSLTFRLSRNCYWNKCAFCPVYKYGARFSKRSIDEVKEDIRRAVLLDDLMFEQGIGSFLYHEGELAKADRLVQKIERARWEAGFLDEDAQEESLPDLDPRLSWFLPWFRDKPNLLDSFRHILSWRISGSKTCFLGDADSLVLKPEFIEEVIGLIKRSFPSLERFTIYGRTSSAARLKTEAELKRLKRAGLDRVHFGLESGSDKVLELAGKGITKQEHITGALKAREAGLSCSVYVMPGLGGMELSSEHASETAEMITRISPDFVRIRTLQIFPGTGLERKASSGSFTEASEEQTVREIRAIVEGVHCATEIMSDSATNLLSISGSLPRDRASMLARIDAYLSLSQREKLEFSLKARVSSFYGQYGGLSRDIYECIEPFIQGGSLNPAKASDDELNQGISLVRSKLMP